MSQEQIKIKDTEFSELKMLQGKFQETIFKFGTLSVEKIELDKAIAEFIEKDKKLKEEWLNLQKMENDFMDNIAKNYGDGGLDPVSGVFIPSVKS